MLKEDGRSFRGELKEKGKRVFRRVALPAIQATAAIGAIVGVTDIVFNTGNELDKDSQINARVSQAYPRTVSEEQYKLAQKELKKFDKDYTTSPHMFIDRNTLSIKIPENVAQKLNLIDQENQRSKDASALKSQLEDEYSIDERGTRRGLLILGLSSLMYNIPDMARGAVSMFRKFRGAPSSSKTANS